MATKKTLTAEQRKMMEEDERKAVGRFVDQPGQWVDVTPPSVKKRQQKAWEKYKATTKKAK